MTNPTPDSFDTDPGTPDATDVVDEVKVAEAQGRDGGLRENDSAVDPADVPWPAGVDEAGA